MTIETWLAFVAACLVFSSTPGVGILATVNHAVTTNTKYTAFSILGLEAALAIYVLIVSVGLNAILAESLLLFGIIKLCGAGYLIWLGAQKLIAKNGLSEPTNSESPRSPSNAIRTGMLVNFSNPKSIIFLAAFFPQFINPNGPIAFQYLILGLTMIVIDMLFHSLYAVFATKAKKYIYSERGSLMVNRIFGLLFIGAGLLMAKSSRVDA